MAGTISSMGCPITSELLRADPGCECRSHGECGVLGAAMQRGAEQWVKLLVTHHVHPAPTCSSACRNPANILQLGHGEPAGALMPRELGQRCSHHPCSCAALPTL